MLKIIWNAVTGAFKRIKDSWVKIWSDGIYSNFKDRRWMKLFFDITLVGVWIYALLTWPISYVVVTIAVAMILMLFNGLAPNRGESLTGDLMYPFMITLMFAGGFWIYWNIAEVAIFAGIFVIPAITNEILERRIAYNRQLAPPIG